MPDLLMTTSQPNQPKLRFGMILLQGPDSQTPFTALKVAHSIIKQNHALEQVFLFHDAAHLANQFRHVADRENSIQKQWQDFANTHKIALNVCISAGIKRGIYNQTEAERYGIPAATIADGFNLVGLGELAEIINNYDKVITLGRFQA